MLGVVELICGPLLKQELRRLRPENVLGVGVLFGPITDGPKNRQRCTDLDLSLKPVLPQLNFMSRRHRTSAANSRIGFLSRRD